MSARPTDPVARFWRKVNKDGPLTSAGLGLCWQWRGAPHKSGYGRHSPTPGAIVYAHRFAYTLLVGPIPAGLQIDHLCRNTMCVRPEHLEAVTQRTNMLRGIGPQAINHRKTHCVNGHPLAGESLYAYVREDGRSARRCRTCNTAHAREYRKRRTGQVA